MFRNYILLFLNEKIMWLFNMHNTAAKSNTYSLSLLTYCSCSSNTVSVTLNVGKIVCMEEMFVFLRSEY